MKPNYPIGSVDRSLRLLVLMSERGTLRLSDAAEILEVSQSTAHRLFDMLKYYDFVKQDPLTREYHAGPALVDIGLAALHSLEIRRETRPYLEALGNELQETVHLLVLRGSDSVFLDVFEPPARAVRSTSRVGTNLPAHTTSGGKALLAQLSPEMLHALYPEDELPRLTDRTIAQRSDLEQELAEIRDRGFAVNLGESEPDVGGVAVVLVDRLEEPRGALVVTAPISRLTPEDVPRFGQAALAAAERWRERVPQHLGPPAPSPQPVD